MGLSALSCLVETRAHSPVVGGPQGPPVSPLWQSPGDSASEQGARWGEKAGAEAEGCGVKKRGLAAARGQSAGHPGHETGARPAGAAALPGLPSPAGQCRSSREAGEGVKQGEVWRAAVSHGSVWALWG